MIDVIEKPTVSPLTRIPPGAWRVILWVTPMVTVHLDDECIALGGNLYAGAPWPSREVAEEAMRKLAASPDFHAWRALGLVDARGVRFFPAGG